MCTYVYKSVHGGGLRTNHIWTQVIKTAIQELLPKESSALLLTLVSTANWKSELQSKHHPQVQIRWVSVKLKQNTLLRNISKTRDSTREHSQHIRNNSNLTQQRPGQEDPVERYRCTWYKLCFPFSIVFKNYILSRNRVCMILPNHILGKFKVDEVKQWH